MDARLLQLLEILLIDRLPRCLSRVVYMFRHIAGLGLELRSFSGRRILTFVEISIEIATNVV